MLIKNKNLTKKYIIITKLFFNLFFKMLGVIFFITILTFLLYYFSSGMSQRFGSNFFYKVNEVILTKYLGVDFSKLDKYLDILIIKTKTLIIKPEIEKIELVVNQKTILQLEKQRQIKIKNSLNAPEFLMHNILIKHENKKLKGKIRIKGDRAIHWQNRNTTSYKIDMRKNDRIWGLEEFSIQKPITRNYTYEYLFHKFLEETGHLSLKYFFVNLYINDENRGLYAVEESFSKELLERQQKRNGPIFGIDEKISTSYPNVHYDLYSNEFWLEEQPSLIKSAFSILNNQKDNEKDINIGDHFDLDKWASFFAVIDIMGVHHGSISKSVKLYFNPVQAKFEPIGFDGHHNPNLFKDFLILDFMDIDNKNCSYICYDREWYLKFFKNIDGSNNAKFLELYIKALKDISSKEFLEYFNSEYFGKINENNKQLQSEVSKKDLNYYKGLGLYIFDKNFLSKRANYIIDRLDKHANKDINENNFYFSDNKKLNIIDNANIKYLNGEYYLTKDLIIEENYLLSKNDKLNINKGVKIFFKKDAILFSEGAISFNGTSDKPILVYSEKGYGSLILSNNSYKIQNTIFQNLSFPKSKDKILYGGINIINSNLNIIDTEIKSSNSEDAINIISSKSFIENLTITNSFADAIDIDFGELVFNNIICEDISNDCLDISGGKIEGIRFKATNVNDKGLSFGENSIGSLSDAYFTNNKLAIAVKDGSNLFLSKFFLKKNEYDIAIFNKKQEYDGSKVELDGINEESMPNILLGTNNKIISSYNVGITRLSNKYINNLFY